ncbi:hypothetical protein BDR04DRAFT_464107 [Suillus decipiens]|nr:hypothetical protein BDR04DRAFT_464107 [Suillus decipiens]
MSPPYGPPSSPLTRTPFSTNMTIVSNDPTLWPIIDESRFSSYFSVAAFAIVTYDWSEHDNIKILLISCNYFQHLH